MNIILNKVVLNPNPDAIKLCIVCGEPLPKGFQKQLNKGNKNNDAFLGELVEEYHKMNTNPQCRNKKPKD